jgi:hypothetical protein
MKNLIRKILKEENPSQSNEENPLQSKVDVMIERRGILHTIKSFRGYEIFQEILPKYFNDDSHKIDLINEICESEEEVSGGYIYFYELNGDDIEYENWMVDDVEYNSVLTYVQSNQVVGQTYMRDADEEEFYDEAIDTIIVPLKELEGPTLNKIFELLVYHYL